MEKGSVDLRLAERSCADPFGRAGLPAPRVAGSESKPEVVGGILESCTAPRHGTW